MVDLIQAKVTRTRLTFIPQSDTDDEGYNEFESPDSDSEFDVMVTNNSDQFASFQLELSAAGVNPSSGLKWYRVEPRISTKKPPGQTTAFHVKVTKAPVPAYDTTIDLTVKAFSIESAKLVTEETLSLRIEKPQRSFRVYLPVKTLKVMLGDSVKVPVLVYNLSPKHSNITLTFSEIEDPEPRIAIRSQRLDSQGLDDSEQTPQLNPSWFSPRFGQNIEQIVPIDAGESAEAFFQFRPPASIVALSHIYHFKIEARSDTSTYGTRERGILEILPWGSVVWDCHNQRQTTPVPRSRRNWLKSRSAAIYELSFENQSNLFQRVQLQVSEREKDLLLPEELELEPGDPPQDIDVEAHNRRPWIGLHRKSLFSVVPKLFDRAGQESSIRPTPSVRVFELWVKPIIPVWAQLLGLLLIALLLWLAYWLYFPSLHQGAVNSVRLVGNGGIVVSASSDQTVRRWQVENNAWLPLSHLKDEGVIVTTPDNQKDKPTRQIPVGISPQKTEDEPKEIPQAVHVIRQIPDHEGQIALGLENGDIQLWDVMQRQQLQEPFPKQQTDRVFALDFTRSSRYLFSGHGSGRVYQWDAQKGKPIADGAYPRFSISALRVSESQADDGLNLVAVAGRYNKLAFWDWERHRLFELPYASQTQQQMSQFDPIVGQHDYIEGLDVTDDGKLLVTADSRGYISLWDMHQIRTCILKEPEPAKVKTDGLQDKPNTLHSLKTCSHTLLKQWKGGQDQPVRAVAFSQNSCYLASGGDDGRVMLWKLSDIMPLPSMSQEIQDQGKNLAALSWMRFIRTAGINSVDIKALDDRLLIVTGDDRDRVRLFRVNQESDHANCQ